MRTDPGKRPKLALEVGFRSLDREFLEASVLNHSPNCPDLDNQEKFLMVCQKKLPGFLRMRGLCILKLVLTSVLLKQCALESSEDLVRMQILSL